MYGRENGRTAACQDLHAVAGCVVQSIKEYRREHLTCIIFSLFCLTFPPPARSSFSSCFLVPCWYIVLTCSHPYPSCLLEHPLQILSSLGLVPSPCFHMSSNRIVTPHHGGPYLALMSSNGIVTPIMVVQILSSLFY